MVFRYLGDLGSSFILIEASPRGGTSWGKLTKSGEQLASSILKRGNGNLQILFPLKPIKTSIHGGLSPRFMTRGQELDIHYTSVYQLIVHQIVNCPFNGMEYSLPFPSPWLFWETDINWPSWNQPSLASPARSSSQQSPTSRGCRWSFWHLVSDSLDDISIYLVLLVNNTKYHLFGDIQWYLVLFSDVWMWSHSIWKHSWCKHIWQNLYSRMDLVQKKVVSCKKTWFLACLSVHVSAGLAGRPT